MEIIKSGEYVTRDGSIAKLTVGSDHGYWSGVVNGVGSVWRPNGEFVRRWQCGGKELDIIGEFVA